MAVILIYFIVGLIATDVEASKDYIVYGTAGGSQGSAGLYGGYYEFGKKLDMELTHIDQARYKGGSMYGIGVYSLSYDPVSKDLLLHGSGSLDHFLAKVDPCKNVKIEEQNFYFSPLNEIYEGPFALYDSAVYYVAREHRPLDKVSVRVSLTIRKVTGCETADDPFIDRRGRARSECSVEVAKIVSDEEIYRAKKGPISDYIAASIVEDIKTVGSTLFVLKKNEKLYFFVQIAKPLNPSGRIDKYSLNLYEVEEGGQAKILRSTTVDKKWTRYIMKSIGDISYKDGLLCWSTFENIFCESWPRTGSVPSVSHVLKKGDARSVCGVSGFRKTYQDVITGIQIMKSNPLQIAFGCWGSWINNGGAGYLYSNSQGTVRNVTAMEGTKGKIFAGAMVAVDGCTHQ